MNLCTNLVSLACTSVRLGLIHSIIILDEFALILHIYCASVYYISLIIFINVKLRYLFLHQALFDTIAYVF